MHIFKAFPELKVERINFTGQHNFSVLQKTLTQIRNKNLFDLVLQPLERIRVT